MTDHILYDVEDRIATITLNRPEAMNSYTVEMMRDLTAAMKRAEADHDVRVVILRGAGRAFCAGADLGGGGDYQSGERLADRSVFDDMVGLTESGGRTPMWTLRKPVIAQVHGYCIAAGHDLAAQCDIIIAADDARFYHPEARQLGVTWRHMSVYHAGPQWAKIMMFTGDPISGSQAEKIGLVARAVPADDLEAVVRRLAMRIAQVPTEILALNKATINKAVEEMGFGSYLEYGAIMDAIAHATPPFDEFMQTARSEGLAAAVEKRDGPFRQLPLSFDELDDDRA